jgi:hypothetical protein
LRRMHRGRADRTHPLCCGCHGCKQTGLQHIPA